MSALLEGLADESGRIPFSLSGGDPIDHVQNGIPFDSNGSVAASLNGIIDHYHQGLPFDADGRLVITTDDVVRYGGGAAPFDADNALCAAGTPPVTHWNSGVPYTDNGKIAGSDVSVYEFVFNGVDQYAVMPDWTPLGVPFEVRVEATPETLGTEMRFVSADGDLPAVRKFSNDAYSTRFIDVDDSNHTAGSTVIATSGVPADVDVDFQSDRVRTTVNGIQGISSQFTPKSVTMVPLSLIAAGNTVPTYPWHGPLSALLLQDNSPIQDTYANMGDGNRYGELEQPIVIEGDFDISGEHIRQDGAGSAVGLLGMADGSFSPHILAWNSTAAGNENNISLRGETGGGTTWNGALDNVAQGQHFTWKIERRINANTLYIDGASLGALQYQDTFRFDAIGKVQTNFIPALSTQQNIVIKDIDNNLTWNYPLDEGPTTDTGPELISGAPTTTGSLATWDGSTLHLEGTNSSGTFEGAGVVSGGDYHVTFDYNTSAANTYIRLGGGGNIAVIPGPAVGTFNEVLSAQGTGYILNIASDNNSGDFTNFSVKSATGGDIIHNIDSSTQGNYADKPIFDTDALMGNGTRYVEIPQFTIGAGEDFRVSYGSIMASTSVVAMLGATEPAGNACRILVNGKDQGTAPGRVVVTYSDGGGTDNLVGAVSNIADLQHYSLEVSRISGSTSATVDGAASVSIGSVNGELRINSLGVWRDILSNRVPAGRTYQNVTLENLTTQEYIQYRIDEGAGLVVKAYDRSGDEIPASAGTITPDADWQYIPEYSNNGAWTPDTDWTFIDSNTRYYPMNEGSGDTFHEAYSNPMPTYRSPNLISNGNFATTADWVISGGWTIDTVSGVAIFNGATDESMIQTFVTTPGKTYQVDFDIEIMVNQPVMAASGFATPVSGPVTVAAGNTQAVIINETISKHIVRTIYAESPSTEFGFAGNGGTEFTVTNVEVREIVPGSLDATIINYTDNWLESVP